MRFESPIAFLLLTLLPLVLRSGRADRGIPYTPPLSLSVVRSLFSSFRANSRAKVLSLLFTAAFVALVVALARPQRVVQAVENDWSGRDLILALDISGSMQALDFQIAGQEVDRLTALKSVITAFVADRPGDRIGLVVFGDQVFTQCPLTLDHNAVNQFVSELAVGMAGQGTAIGDALAVSLKRLRGIEANSRAIILVTDGKNNSGNVSPAEVSQLAKSLGIKVYVVGIGGPEPAPFPVKSPLGVTMIMERVMEYDEETLRTIASTTGGYYFNAKNMEGLIEVYREIDRLELRADTSYKSASYEEEFRPFLITAILLFGSFLVLRSTYFLKVSAV